MIEMTAWAPAATFWSCGWDAIDGGIQFGTIVSRTVVLSASPHSLDTCSQYDVDDTSDGTARIADVPLFAGREVSGNVPSYHWNAIGWVPVTSAKRVAPKPVTTSPPAGCTTIFGALHGSTVMVMVLLSADEPQVFDARTQ